MSIIRRMDMENMGYALEFIVVLEVLARAIGQKLINKGDRNPKGGN